ncbi:MAG: hypothetical protein ACI8QC_003944 [Planctomycetota bacterium]|jgi:uncharacterized protein (DUF885 family)
MRPVPFAPFLLLGSTLIWTACGGLPGPGAPRRELELGAAPRCEQMLAELHLGRLDRSPVLRAQQNPTAGAPYWQLVNEDGRERRRYLLEQEAVRLQDFDLRGLSSDLRLTHEAALRMVARELEALEWQDHEPLLSRAGGLHMSGPQSMLDLPWPRNEAELADQLARLSALGPALRDLSGELERRQELGTLPPRRVLGQAREDIATLLLGAPFDQTPDASPDPMTPTDGVLLAEVRKRVEAMSGIDAAARRARMREASRILLEDVGPAYRELSLRIEELAPRAQNEVGAWARPNGRAWYSSRTVRATDMDLVPADLHAFGLREVARRRAILRALQTQLSSDSSPEVFLRVLREDERWYLPTDGAGRAALLEDVTRWTGIFRDNLAQLVAEAPELELGIKLLPAPLLATHVPVRFLQAPSRTTRAPILGVETAGWERIPRWLAPAWTSAAGIPGEALRQHYLRAGGDVPDLLRLAEAPALEAGWRLYAARRTDLLDLLESPQARVGRVMLELWHGLLLVADTGLHDQRWTRTYAVDYLFKGSAYPLITCIDAVERIIEEPGAACSGMAGLSGLIHMELDAREALGDDFSQPAFNHAVLSQGPLPLDLLQVALKLWTSEQ